MTDSTFSDQLRFLSGDHAGDDAHSHGPHEAGLTSDQISTFKTVFIIVYLGITYIGLLPTVVGSCKNNETTLSFMNCFAAGVFLSIALIHLLPEGGEQYDSWASEQGYAEPFPLPYTVIFLGYLIAVMVDRIFNKNRGQSEATKFVRVADTSVKAVEAEIDRKDDQKDKEVTNQESFRPLEIESGKTEEQK